MNKSNYITLYADEFDIDTWREYCDICDVPYESNEITICFDDKDVDYT